MIKLFLIDPLFITAQTEFVAVNTKVYAFKVIILDTI